ncbi:MAG: hypothetical protein IMF16_01910, partial [Proteobacteria bacterium]|nr:hypothetical protein [Pseudomonadota bacterium]
LSGGSDSTLNALTVMPDHVHILATPLEEASGRWFVLAKILHSVKFGSALKINRLRGRRGSLWQSESFDRIVRDEKEFDEKASYILGNPVKAELIEDAWEYDGFWCEGMDDSLGAHPAVDDRVGACPTEGDYPGGRGDLENTFGPEDVFNYIYAILHSPTYRERYAEFLKRDFPRLPFTSNRKLFAKLAEKGAELVAYHLLESKELAEVEAALIGEGKNVVERVRYDGNEHRVYVNKTQYFADVPSDVWSFKVGGYQVCEKWLKDRKGRPLSYDDQEHYTKVTVALRETLRLMQEIDDAIPSWPIA